MATPYIMPLGFIHRPTEDGTTIMLTNPEDSLNLELGTPVTVWRYSQGRLAIARVRGRISAVGYVTATFITVESQTDPRWPEDEQLLLPKTPVYLAQPDSFEPDPSRMLTQEQAETMQGLAELYARLTGPRAPEPSGPGHQTGNTFLSRDYPEKGKDIHLTDFPHSETL